jgi:predicted amidohydrolase
VLKETLHIAIFQLNLVWEDPVANRAKIDQLLQDVSETTDVVFLPEMFTTGFSMNVTELAEPMEGETIQWMKSCCNDYQLALCGSLIIVENDQYFNRLVFVEPSGEVHFYNKRHLFSMGNEADYFEKGTERLVVLYKGWRICPLICYDLRFPVWSRNRNEYNLLVYLANWPQSRSDVWNTMLKARAIENQSFVVGVNRVGVDGQKIAYSGDSQIIGAKGNCISGSNEEDEIIISAQISFTELAKFRTSFPVLNDADSFDIE